MLSSHVESPEVNRWRAVDQSSISNNLQNTFCVGFPTRHAVHMYAIKPVFESVPGVSDPTITLQAVAPN